ncbi:protein of unknown function [Magnetospirillum sp. XM-1]|nr:protein of unknown function [Magnetospirillum sp. XM-1]
MPRKTTLRPEVSAWSWCQSFDFIEKDLAQPVGFEPTTSAFGEFPVLLLTSSYCDYKSISLMV